MKRQRHENQVQLTAQQLKALPAFDGFPYLTTRIVAAFYHISLLPRSFEGELLRYIAHRQIAANQLPCCLVFGPENCLFYDIDGGEYHSHDIPRGGCAACGELRLCLELEVNEELQSRQQLLAAYVKERNQGRGYLLGDPTKGGHNATADENLRLAGGRPG